MNFASDRIVFSPRDVDLTRSPLRSSLRVPTYVLGAFNPGLTRLPSGNLLLMVRVAEALRDCAGGGSVHALRWDPDHGYTTDSYDGLEVDTTDPRVLSLRGHPWKVLALTSLSWLLPVELSPDGLEVREVHYDRAIAPHRPSQQYGLEDARISFVNGIWYMTTCSVSAERHATTLYLSTDGLNYEWKGIVLDHQNKDMLLFEGLVGGQFQALTRPLGELYFAYPPHSRFAPGPSINLASSPDAVHWKPADTALIRPRRDSPSVMKVGGGTPPVATPRGWLMLYHGVEPGTVTGIYRTFWALLDSADPSRILEVHDHVPLLEARADLTAELEDLMYLSNIVFSTGIVADGDDYLVASGEGDLACRLTRIPRAVFDQKPSSDPWGGV